MGFWDRVSRTLDALAEELVPDDVRDEIDGARELLDRGQHHAAAAALETVLRKKPDHAGARHLLGVARLRAGDATRAEQAFAEAARRRAGFLEALIGLGEARLELGNAAGALAALRDALAQAGGDRAALAEIYRGLGRAHLLAGDAEKGVRELRKALIEEPGDADAVARLAEALMGGPVGDVDLADLRAPLEKACAAEGGPAAALLALARLELAARRSAAALPLLERALASAQAQGATRAAVLEAAAQAAAAQGDRAGAHQRLLEALALAPSARLHRRLAELHRGVGSVDAAVAAYEAAAALGDVEAAEAGLELALGAGLYQRAAAVAARLPAGHGGALAARGVAALAAGEEQAARALFEKAVAAGERREAPLALARLGLGEPGGAERALAAASELLARDASDPAARLLWADARRRQLGDSAGAGGGDATASTHVLLGRAVTLTRGSELLASLAADASYALESYDRPLLLTVMGEFSTGKSTFVNALLGAEVAPTGITPTTATINVLKYGRERRGRIVYRDDHEREIAWEDVPGTLRELDAAEAARIRVVELLYPLEALERVSIVDTPGLNSILPEHEQTARDFIRHADAVVWLFSAMQAGKASEREALERIRGEGKRVLGVVNKVDQASPEELAQILAHLGGALGGEVEAFVPVSARRALDARVKGGAAAAEALAAAHWPELERALEERFFAQARAIKRAQAARRLAALASAAAARVEQALAARQRDADQLRQAAVTARADAELFRRQAVLEEGKRMAERLARAYRGAAREVLELVRPRRLPFGSNTATEADRDYLIGLLDRALVTLLEPTRRMAAEAVTAAHATAGEPPDAALALLEARVFDRCRAYLRGYLRGGSVDEFFARTLPKLSLDEDSVYHALVRGAPDLAEELIAPLGDAGDAALRALAARLDARAATADLRRFELEVLAGAIDRLAAGAGDPA